MHRIRFLLALAAALLLPACGGGDKPSVVANDVVQTKFAVAVDLRRASTSTVTIAKGEALPVVATVSRITETVRNGSVIRTETAPAVNEIVRFESPAGTFNPATATTNAQGEATVTFTAGQAAGGFRLTATLDRQGAATTPGTRNFSVVDPLAPRITLELLNAAGAPTGAADPGEEVRVRVLAEGVEGVPGDARHVPVVGATVRVTSDAGAFRPSSGIVTTDGQGRGEIVFIAGNRGTVSNIAATATLQGRVTTQTAAFEVRGPDVELGAGDPFQVGVLAIDVPQLSAGGQTAISVQIRDRATGAPVTPGTPIRFTSICSANGTAVIESPVLAVDGVATTLYQALPGCQGNDAVFAIFEREGGEPREARGAVFVAAPTAGKIQFVDSSPPAIALRGFGSDAMPDVAIVTFRVLSMTDIPVQGRSVAFALTNTAGGLQLVEGSGITDAQGLVRARVRAGTVPATVRVIATVTGLGLTTQSGTIVVSNGAPDQDSFSLSASSLSPEAFNFDGVGIDFTIRVGDHANNPAPDGTRVLFTAEGGQIQPACTTDAGACTVRWVSSAPRPADGRVTVFARTVGDESFTDANGNGLYDLGETWTDLPEAFLDANENGLWNAGEFFGDIDNNGAYSGANGRFDGAACASGCGVTRSVEIREDIVIVMATSAVAIEIEPSAVTVTQFSPRTVRVYLSDLNGNLPPAGSTVEIATTAGTLSGTTSYTVPESNARGPLVLTVSLAGTGTTRTGLLTVRVTTPAGVESTRSIQVTEQDGCSLGFSPAPSGCTGSGKQAATVGHGQVERLVVMPDRVALGAAGEGEEHLRVWIYGHDGKLLPGFVPSVTCDMAGTTGLAASASRITGATADGGPALVRLRLARAEGADGQGTCTLSAGGRTATVEVH